MAKKYLIITLILLATLFSYSVFAANDIGDAARDMGNEMSNSWDKMANTAENMGNNIQGAANSVGGTIGNFFGMNDENNTDNTTDDYNNINNVTANTTDNNNTTDYTATITAAGATTNNGLFGMGSTMWTWVILAVLGIAIVALVWYYGAQTTERHNK